MLSSKSFAIGEKELEAVAPAKGPAFAAADALFIDQLRAGNAEAFDKLVIRYSNDIYALLYRLTSDAEEAADLTQETFLRALRAISGFRGDSDLRTWLYRIAINESRNRFRWWKRRRRESTVSLDESIGSSESVYQDVIPDRSPNPEQEALRREREHILQNALRELPAIYREPVVLFDIEGLSYDEICKLLEPFNSTGKVLTPETEISADLNIDSVAVMDFVMEVEDHFDIEIPLNVVSETHSISDLAAVVAPATAAITAGGQCQDGRRCDGQYSG